MEEENEVRVTVEAENEMRKKQKDLLVRTKFLKIKECNYVRYNSSMLIITLAI